MQPAKNVAIRKRTQIAKENSKMFIWVAGASVLLGIALVTILFLVQVILFNQKIIDEKNKTNETLVHNNSIVEELQAQVRVLDTNQALIDSKASADDDTLQVILDALPSEPNSLALGASLQNKLLAGISGLSINTLQVNPIQGVEYISEYYTTLSNNDDGFAKQITFTFSVTGSETALKKALRNIEKSIRTICLTSLNIENQGKKLVMTVKGHAYYEPSKIVELRDKIIKQ